MYTLVNPSFTIWKWDLRGSKSYRYVFVMCFEPALKVPFRVAWRLCFSHVINDFKSVLIYIFLKYNFWCFVEQNITQLIIMGSVDQLLYTIAILNVSAQTDSVNPNKTLLNAAYDQGLHCLLLIKLLLHTQAIKWTCSNFMTSTVKS